MKASTDIPVDAKIAVKVVYSLAKARKPLRLVEIAEQTGIVKSHVLYHLKHLIRDNIVIHDGDTYTCQTFFYRDETKGDLGSLLKVLINLLTKELIIKEGVTEEELGEQILQNTMMFIRLYKEGLFS